MSLLAEMGRIAAEMVHDVLDSYVERDAEKARNVCERDRSVDDFYKRFYFRAPKIAAIAGEMVRSPQMLRRRMREGIEFFRFLRERQEPAH